MLPKLVLVVLLGIAVFIYWYALFIAFAMSGTSTLAGAFTKLALLPLLFLIPLIVALFVSGPDKRKNRIRLIMVAIVLPLLSALVMFWKNISEFYQDKAYLKRVHRNYVNALAKASSDPARAYLTCYLANHFENADCAEALKTVSDGRFCQTLCSDNQGSDPEISKICSTYGISLKINCANIMIRKMDPQSPLDICKEAGLMNYRSGDTFFQGHYYDCLNSTLRVGTEYRTLGELLKIKTNGLPTHTQAPLPN